MWLCSLLCYWQGESIAGTSNVAVNTALPANKGKMTIHTLSIDLEEVRRPRGYQPRSSSVHLGTGKGVRWCRACNEKIPPGENHLTIDSHLSSGYRSDIHICMPCLKDFSCGVGNEEEEC